MVNEVTQIKSSNTNLISAKISEIKLRFPWLHRLAVIHVVAFILSLVAMSIDHRELMGINIWIKPAKFLLSTFILLWTLGWYLLILPFQEKTKTFVAYAMTFLLTLENILISSQAARGVQSHYNTTSWYDGLVFATMGLAIGLLTAIVVWITAKTFSNNIKVSTGMLWGIRIAWVAFLFGSAAGGGTMIGQRAHTVGIPDGGEGVPFLNWSTIGGDLRVAHFLGLHAIQVIPLVTYFIYQKIKKDKVATTLSIGLAFLYLGWIVFTFYQAKAGEPFVAL